MTHLLVILGHTNTDDGLLSASARLRCVAAAVYLQKQQVDFVLTTGAYGDNFNRSPVPHGALLIDELKRQTEMPGVEILGYTTTAFTEEDIYYARRVYHDRSCTKVTFITSHFHGPRVTEIAKHIFRDCRIEILLSRDGSDIADSTRREEVLRIMRFRKAWVDLPLYSGEAKFPVHIYNNAMDQHKHSDSLSLAIVTGAFAFSCYPHTKIDYAQASLETSALLVACAIVGLGLLFLYFRFAAFAFIARQILRGLELGWGVPGFSYNYDRFYLSRWPWLRFFRTSRVLAAITFVMIFGNCTVAVFIAVKCLTRR